MPLPSPLDGELEALVRADHSLDQPTPDQADVLAVFAERYASLARRTGDPEQLRLALRAIDAALDFVYDIRDELPVLALCWRTAEVLGLDPVEEFTRAARRSPTTMIDFTGRPPDARSLDAMAYVEGEDADGFRYMRTW